MASGRIGLIAGAGRFPFLVAQGARQAGHEVVIVGLRGLADPSLRELADRFYWSGVVRLGRWIRIFRREGVARAIMAGSVRKREMYGRFRLLRYLPDWTTIRLWFFVAADKRNDTLLRAAADEMQRKGVTLSNSVEFCPDHLARPGVMTRLQPSAAQHRDAEFGWRIAKEIGRLDIGQAVAVKEQEVIAVEAIEGTDDMIRRAGALCRSGGWTLVKVAKPDQDMRFDVPTVGVNTIENLHAHGARMLVVEAGKTLMVDREKVVAAAERLGIVLMGL
ncbi:MAG: LpxI family protein [Phycisphaerae bacterium]